MKLEERAINCKHWRWLPGMRCVHRWIGSIRVLADENGEQSESYVVLPDSDGNAVMAIEECGTMEGFPDGSAHPFVPDLTDPATMGCLLALVRDAYKDAYAGASSLHDENGCWGVRDCDGFIIATGRSEREALVIALEKADAE